jgi:hypothetical protein
VVHAREPDRPAPLGNRGDERESRVLGLDVVDQLAVEVVGLNPHDVLGLGLQPLRNQEHQLPQDRVPGEQEIQNGNPRRGSPSMSQFS